MRLHHFNLNLIKTFVLVAQEASFTKAAKKLFVEQSAVSKAIKKLEIDLETELFKRTKKNVTLTSKGLGLLPLAISILESGEEFLKFSQDHENEISGTLHFGAESPLSTILMPDVILEISTTYPKLWPMMYTGMTQDLIERLKNRKLEFAVLLYEGKRIKELEYCPIGSLNFKVVASTKINNEALNSFIGSREVNDSDSPHLPTFNKLKRLNKALQIKYSANDLLAYKELILKGLGIGLLPESMISHDVKLKKLRLLHTELKLKFSVQLVHHGSYPLSQEALCMISIIKDKLKMCTTNI
jgi:DNA-binding transcriptional LysR family regulator